MGSRAGLVNGAGSRGERRAREVFFDSTAFRIRERGATSRGRRRAPRAERETRSAAHSTFSRGHVPMGAPCLEARFFARTAGKATGASEAGLARRAIPKDGQGSRRFSGLSRASLVSGVRGKGSRALDSHLAARSHLTSALVIVSCRGYTWRSHERAVGDAVCRKPRTHTSRVAYVGSFASRRAAAATRCSTSEQRAPAATAVCSDSGRVCSIKIGLGFCLVVVAVVRG